MKSFLFNYQTIVRFSQPIIDHAILLRCLPARCLYQDIREEHLIAGERNRLHEGEDGFGNRVVYGYLDNPHSRWAYTCCGIVTQTPYLVERGNLPPDMYLAPSKLTTMKEKTKTCRRGNATEDAMAICEQVNGLLTYTPSATTIETRVDEVMRTGRGVCQDYAHLMIALCRKAGIPARYACGFVEGTGTTHAWVEILDGQHWIGMDPTYNQLIEYGYVKLAHGRDAADCPVNRGCYKNAAIEENEIIVTLEELT